MAERKPQMSYASAHWLFTGRNALEPYRPELVDIARLEGRFREAANGYARKRNYDFARRVIDGGAAVEDLAFLVISGEPKSMMRIIGDGYVRGVAGQALHEVSERCRVPQSRWSEYFADDKPDLLPPELAKLFHGAWEQFTEANGIQPISLEPRS